MSESIGGSFEYITAKTMRKMLTAAAAPAKPRAASQPMILSQSGEREEDFLRVVVTMQQERPEASGGMRARARCTRASCAASA